ncbi:MAG: hypothetical protein JSS76_16325 [Bacteroidetes bacterium]|nr:hypothetical protein [Bacteroidota bacterium]
MILKPMLLGAFMAFCLVAFSQRCSTDSLQLYASGDFNYQGTGFSDVSELPCATSGIYSEIVIPFTTYSGGARALTLDDSTSVPVSKVYAIRIDGVSGLPSGMCWTVKPATSMASDNVVGGLIIKGTTSASVAQYPLDVTLSLDVQGSGIFGYTSLHPDNYRTVLGQPSVRVADANGNCPPAN